MRRTLALTALMALVVAGLALLPIPVPKAEMFLPVIQAQTPGSYGVLIQPLKAKPISNIITAVDTEAAMYIKYFGPGATATVDVTAANVTFQVGGVAYTGFECPVSGALGGIIDTSNAACNTMGEVVDIINATAANFSTGYFRAVLAAAVRSDSSNAAFLADAADNEVTTPNGEKLIWDSSVLDDSQVGLWDETLGIRNWMSGPRLTVNPFADRDSVLMYAHENVANAGTPGNIEIHCVAENYRDGGVSSETDRITFLKLGGTTGVTVLVNEFINAGGLRCSGEKLFMRRLWSGNDTTAQTLFVTGYHVPKQ